MESRLLNGHGLSIHSSEEILGGVEPGCEYLSDYQEENIRRRRSGAPKLMNVNHRKWSSSKKTWAVPWGDDRP